MKLESEIEVSKFVVPAEGQGAPAERRPKFWRDDFGLVPGFPERGNGG